jgi:hypothetical protein
MLIIRGSRLELVAFNPLVPGFDEQLPVICWSTSVMSVSKGRRA